MPPEIHRVLGIDPGLQRTGWGVIEVSGNRLRYVAHGVVRTTAALALAQRLVQIETGLLQVIEALKPHTAAVEEIFVNSNPGSALKLGVARGVALLTPARMGLSVAEYPANLVKKSVVGTGHAAKDQVMMMMRVLLPGCDVENSDAADALAVAICHAHHGATAALIGGKMAGAAR